MTRVGSEGLLLLLLLLGFAGFRDADAKASSEVLFYRDGEPRLSPEVRLERLVRFLEAAAAHSSGSQLRKQRLLELARTKLRGLLRDDMPERPSIIETLQRDSTDPLQYLRELERQRLLPYLEYEPNPRIKPYSLEDGARTRTQARLMSAPLSKDPLLDYPETHYADLERARELENARRMEEAYRHRPAFTYSFDKPEPTREGADPPFAVPPSDPRYYQDEPFRKVSTEKVPTIDQRIADLSEAAREIHSIQLKPQPKLKQMTTRTRDPIDEYAPIGGLLEMNVLPEPRRRAEQDPIVISLGNRLNDDIYFIAIVAGCSAAVMFALVLISLTWCRLQRMSKAAVDVDYPAYGVTGPNKDISPSGDQRLAQSAQMYHFQHHKQQIIAMENRASATRDPGSVSEAESDEENEEGDYTVYECPGLAPTGEMEVKNPLFHDDPTPATPPKSKKEADNSDDNNV